MLVDCPNCARSYKLDAADLGAGGRTLMCPRCSTTWHQPAERAPGPLAVRAVAARPAAALDEAPAPARRVLRPVLAGLALAAVSLTLVGTPAAAYLGRAAVVKAVPRTATLYAALGVRVNVYGIEIDRVEPRRTASSDVTVAGRLRNVAGRRVGVPRLAFEVRDAANRILVAWSESVAGKPIPAGRALDFVSAPHRLPPESLKVVVRLD